MLKHNIIYFFNINLIINLENVSTNNIFFYEQVKNTILDNSYFIRIIFSNKDLILNGIYILINLNNSINDNCKIIEELEKNILFKYKSDKIQNKKIKDNFLYLLNKNNNNKYIVLKISGIWETLNNIGLTFKYISLPIS